MIIRRTRSRASRGVCTCGVLGGLVVGLAAALLGPGEVARATNVSPTPAPNEPAAVTTFAGNGANATINGTGTAASFAAMGGAARVGASLYIGSAGTIRTVDTATGAVGVLVGSASDISCRDNRTAANVRLGRVRSVATDGVMIYSIADCGGVRQTAIAGGATSTLASIAGARAVTYAAPNVYVTAGNLVYKVTTTGKVSTFADLGGEAHALTTDGSNLWVTGSYWGSRSIVKISLATAGMVAVAQEDIGYTAIAYSNGWLYNFASSSNLRAYNATTGEFRSVAGTLFNPGFADGTGTDAWFGRFDQSAGLYGAIVADGSTLWIADTSNHRVRKAVAGQPLPSAIPTGITSSLAIAPGSISTFAGSGATVNADGTGVAASFERPVGVTVVGKTAYVSDRGVIRKADLQTGRVSPFVGSSSAAACTMSANPAEVNIGDNAYLTHDGHYLWASTWNCGLLRISLATGATSVACGAGFDRGVAVGSNGALYSIDRDFNNTEWQVVRLDPTQCTRTLIGQRRYQIHGSGHARGIVVDGTYAWVLVYRAYYDGWIERVDLATGEAVRIPLGMELSNIYSNFTVAGNYAYIAHSIGDPNEPSIHPTLDARIWRLDLTTGVRTLVAGSSFPSGSSNFADGIGSSARMWDMHSMAADGTSLWVVANNRLRRVVPGPTGGPISGTEQPTGSNACNPCGQQSAADGDNVGLYPINAATGNFWHTFEDFAIPGRGIPLHFNRTYNSDPAFSSVDGPFGYGWSYSYGTSLAVWGSTATLHQEDGARVVFVKSGATWAPAAPRTQATLAETSGTWTLVRQARQTLTFDSLGRLISLKDLDGYTTALTYPDPSTTVITEPAGRMLTLSYTGSRITRVSDSATPSRSVTFEYNDGNGNLTDAIDVAGGHWQFTYDSAHRMLTMRSPKHFGDTTTTPSPVVTNHYDAAGRIDWQSDPLGRTTTFDYSSIVGATKITDPAGEVVVQEYFGGQLGARTVGYGEPNAATWRYSYDPVTAAPTQVIDPDGRITTNYIDAAGNVTATVDPLGRVTTATFNTVNLPTTITDAGGVTTTISYDAAGHILSRAAPLLAADGSVAATKRTVYVYGGTTPVYAGDITGVTDPDGHTTSYRYDAYGNLVASVAPPTPENPAGNTTTYAYNAATGWLTSSVSPRGNVPGGDATAFRTSYEHDAFGNVTVATDPEWSASSPVAHRTVRDYDANLNLESVTDGSGNTTTYTYDAADQLVSQTRPDATTIRNEYWPNGRLQAQVDGAGQATRYGYDALGRMATMTDPLNRVTRYGYDKSGNLATHEDPGGDCAASPKAGCVTYGYDAVNRLTSVTYSDGVTPNVSNVQYDAVGRRVSMTDGTGTSTWAWDSLGRMTRSVDGSGAVVGYSYNLRGQAVTITYPGSAGAVVRRFDAAGRLDRVTDLAGMVTNFAYDANSNLSSTAFPNGTTGTSAYNRNDAPVASELAGPAGSLARLDYGRNGVDHVSALSGSGLGQLSEAYGYNALQQLEAVNGAAVFDYDAADNLTRLRGTTQAFDVANQLVSATTDGGVTASFAYDARGNRTSRSTPGQPAVSYAWDQARRLTSAGPSGSQASYAYNGDGLRVSKALGGAARSFTWDVSGGLPLLIKDGTTSIIYGPNGLPLEQVAADGTTQWFFHDQLGSTRALTNAAGAVGGTWTYDPYGSVQASTGTATTNFRFAGEYSDDETGFVFLRARYYDPATGQFLSRDPLAHITRQPYAYAGNNSLNQIDPFGMAPQTPSFTGRRGGFAAHVATEPQSPGMSCDDYMAYLRVAAAYAQTTADGRYYAMLAAQEARAQRRAATLAEASELKRHAEADRREAERPLFEAMIDDPQFQYVDDVLKVGETVFACGQGGLMAYEIVPSPHAALAGCAAGATASLTNAPPGFGI